MSGRNAGMRLQIELSESLVLVVPPLQGNLNASHDGR